MRILHTSDWHIGRTFHGHPTLDALRTVLDALVEIVREREVDLVVVAGDVFDSATPSGDAFGVLSRTLGALREAGAAVVVTSGNHDSPARLGFQSEYAALAGIHVLTDPDAVETPVTLRDAHGEVDVYGIPYLEPVLLRHRWGLPELRTQADVMTEAMRRIRGAKRDGVRSIVLAHTFAAGGAVEASDAERDITVGGVDVVPLSVFDGIDYAALGHIHGRSQLAPGIRYSGAPLHYSFSEAGKPRGAWLVELGADGLEADGLGADGLGADGLGAVEWVELPVPRPLSVLTGELDALLANPAHASAEQHWVSAVLTDAARPLDAMRRLQARFPHCAHVAHAPAATEGDGAGSYAERVKQRSDDEIIGAFLEHVRAGDGASEAEAEIVRELVAGARAAEVAR